MATVRVNFDFGESLKDGSPSARFPLIEGDSLKDGSPSARFPLIEGESLKDGSPSARFPLIEGDSLKDGNPSVRFPLVLVEILTDIPPEEHMSTDPFPGFGNSSNPLIPAGADPFNSALPGLAFSVHKKPAFSTRVSQSSSGYEVRNALQAYPKWDFELTYEFLEDRTGSESSLKTIMGFFLARLGSFDSWLFKDPDDYLCTNSRCAYTDGVTVDFYFCREMTGGYIERVGQVDTANTITLYLSIAEARTIPATPGPYTVTVAEAASYTEDLGVTINGVTATKVTSGLGAGEYMVNETTGVYTFAAADQNKSTVISYRYEIDPADYTVTMPNRIVFDSAPPEGTLTGDFQFFFVCRFIEDQMDFEKFADKLWSLQQCEFRSLIQ